MKDFYQQVCKALGGENVRLHEPMSRHTTLRAGGMADYFLTPQHTEGLKTAIGLCREYRIPYCILGNGSNLLVGDKGYRGAVLSMGNGFDNCSVKGNRVSAGSGALLSRIARAAAAHSLTGLEFASGIPGTLGGALVMNAGAYGGECKDVVTSVRILDREGNIRTLSADEMEFGYRKSMIESAGYIVLEAQLCLKHGNTEEIHARMGELAARRREKQPLEYPSAGSTFKRPQGHFASKLIEEAGLKGVSVGGAQVSKKHSGFVINTGGATAADILNLCSLVQRRVKEQFGVELELEVKTIGDFGELEQQPGQ